MFETDEDDDNLVLADTVKNAIDYDSDSGNFDSEITALLDKYTLKSLYFDEPWVYIAVNAVAKKLGNMLMPVHSRIIRGGDLVVEPFPQHSLNKLLEKPNAWEFYYSFMMKVGIELTLMGNCIIWKMRFHGQLMILPSEAVDMIFDEAGNLTHYMVNGVMDQASTNNVGLKILPEDVIHIRLPNPASLFWGLSPWLAGRRPVLFERYSSEYLLNFYLKQANPGTILEMGEKSNEKQAMRFLKAMELKWTGRSSQRRTLILPKGVTAKNNQSTFAQQELRDHVRDNKDTIRALLNIPPHEFGTQETGSLGTEETNSQLVNFYESTILPFGGLISGAFSLSYGQSLGKRFVFKFDTSTVAVLKIDENKNADLVAKLLPVMSPNEIRKRLFEMEAHPEGDKIGGVVSAAQPGFFSATEPARQLEESIAKNRSRNFLLKYSEWWTRRKQAGEVGDIKEIEDKYLDQFLEILVKQGVEAVKIVRKLPLTKSLNTKARQEEIEEALSRAFNSFAEVYTETNVKTLQGSGEVGYDLALNVPFKLPNEEEREVLRAENSEGRREFLEARALEQFETVNEGTTKQVMNRIAEGTEQGFSLAKIEQSIFEYFSVNAPKRAMTIARTEVLGATSLGQKAAADDAAELIPGMTKMWLTAGDGRVRSFSSGDQNDHALLDGVSVPIEDDFNMPAGGKMGFPRDPKGAAGETINCRCTLVMVPPDVDLDEGGISFTGLGR